MRVSALGEFGLIDRIAHFLGPPPPDVIVGIGDDVAVMRGFGSEYLLATCDVQVENVHFLRNSISPYQLGKKIVAINVSDIAAVGGTPTWALVSLALPTDIEVGFVDALYQGMKEQMQSAGACIVGGNLSQIRAEVVIDLFLLGRVMADRIILRRGAKQGDSILITGVLGDSKAGFELIRNADLSVTQATRIYLLERHLTPIPRLKEGQVLARTGKVHAMLDVSDGLASDIRHICGASGLGAEIIVGDLPIGPECREAARSAGQDPLEWALKGGEDYELLFTAAHALVPDIQRALFDETGMSSSVIGRIVAKSHGVAGVFPDGRRTSFSRVSAGWDHFAGGDDNQ